jgi:hypothetical protein
MTISHQNITTIVALLTALSQRHDTIHQLAAQIAANVIWRAPDGSLSVPIPPNEIAQLESFITAYLNEAATVHTTLTAILAPKP